MKKNKKEKSQNAEGLIKRKKWGAPQTIFSIVGGVAGVVGATVLGVYLAGGFNEKIVNPNSIDFMYQSNLYNLDYTQIETCEDFEITIVAPNEGVTKDSVTLSFAQNVPSIRSQGYVSNSIISVPEIVKIGQPFKVSLVKGILKDDNGQNILDENGSTIDWINGGISTLFAQSEYNEISRISVQIAVDVPVYKTETIVVNSSGQETNRIVTGETFTLKTKFIPSTSQYMYSDFYQDREGEIVKNESIGTNSAREKKSFYQAINTSAVTHHYDSKYSMHFLAGANPVDEINVAGYTYANAKAQLSFESGLGDLSDAEYYNAMLVNVSSQDGSAISSTVLSLGEASIGGFLVNKSNIDLTLNTTLDIFMQENQYQSASDFIGARVYSTSGALLEGMLSNVVLSFVCDGSDPTKGENAFISVEGGEVVEIDGTTYYKPYIGTSENPIADYRYSYWKLSATEKKNVKIYASLLINTENGIEFYKENDVILRYEINLNITSHEESPLSWTMQSDINVMLTYNPDGTVKPEQISFDGLTDVPQDNIYQDKIFFAYFGIGDREEIIQTANDVIGENGYDLATSGNYSVGADNLYLFVIEGDRLNLFNTGNFKLYYGTTTGQYNGNGTYEMALMCDGFISINVQKSLYRDSVISAQLNTANFDEKDGEKLLNQGSNQTLSVVFRVKPESVPVFEEEFDNEKIRLSIFDNIGTNITSQFILQDSAFTIDQETNEGIVTYILTINGNMSIENEAGIILASIALDYIDEENPLNWSYSISEAICLYSPLTNVIEVRTGDESEYLYDRILNGENTIAVNQSLNVSGSFDVNISYTDDEGQEKQTNSVVELLRTLFGDSFNKIAIIDQKGREDTLEGKWAFAVNQGNAVSITSDGKLFTFKEAENETVVLYIQSLDRRQSTLESAKLKFNVNSVGVQSIKYDSSTAPADGAILDKNEGISNVVLNKYGAKNGIVKLADAVKFYTDVEGQNEYTKVYFTLSTAFLNGSTLSDRMITDLFGKNGVVSLTGEEGAINFEEGTSAQEIRNALVGQKITQIQFKKDFAINQLLKFSASDEGGSVNTSIDLNILSNVSVTNENYTGYAQEEITLTNSVNYNYTSGASSIPLSDLYSYDNFVIAVSDGIDMHYELTETISDTKIATLSNGNMIFEDFWDEESKEFIIYFKPDGDNYYTINKVITFIVQRNILVTNKNGTYYIISTGNGTNIDNYVSITRHDGETAIDGLTVNYDFNGGYLTYDGSVKPADGAEFNFAYNEKELFTNFVVSVGGTELATIPVSIKPINGEIYQTLADSFICDTAIARKVKATEFVSGEKYYYLDGDEYVLDENVTEDNFSQKEYFMEESDVKGTIKAVDNVEYMVVAFSSDLKTWKFNDISGYKIETSQRDNGRNLSFMSVASTGKITFTRQNALLDGLNDNTIYLPLRFTNDGETKLSLKLPLIVSTIGYEQVVYEGKTQEEMLEYSLLTPEELYTKGIYNEVNAGKATQILTQYSFTGEEITDGGIWTTSGKTHKIEYYPISNAPTSQDLIKNISIPLEEGEVKGLLSLNHLPEGTVMYLALKYTVTSATTNLSQVFYYLLKVNGDVDVENSLYAYDGGEEHLSILPNVEKTINLEELFDSTTLHNDEKRFNVKKGDDLLSLISKNEVLSVTVESGTPMTNPSDYSQYIEVSFSEDYSQMTIRPRTNNKITLVIKHTYPGGYDADSLSVVDGEQLYKFIINENSINYSVRYQIDGQTINTNSYVWDITNYDTDQDGETEGRQKVLNVNLIENAQAGSSQSGTVIYNFMQMGLSSGTLEKDIQSYSYDKSTGKLVITLADYIDTDRTVEFAVFTKYGYLGTLTINIEANANYQIKDAYNSKNLTGGNEISFSDIFDITLNGEENTLYAITTITPEGEGKDFVSIDNGKITVVDLIADKDIEFTFTIDFGEDKTYTFTENFTLKANITPKTQIATGSNVIAGENLSIDPNSLFVNSNITEGSNQLSKSTLSITASSASAAFAGLSDNTISTNYVSEIVNVNLSVVATITFNNVSQSFTVQYSFTVYPSVQITTNYPNPQNESTTSQTVEYVENNTTFDNILNDFINHAPIFGNTSRFVLKSAAESSNVISYNSPVAANDYKNGLTITITELRNADVKEGDNHLRNNNTISSTSGITLTRGTWSETGNRNVDSGIDSVVTFTITYQNVSQSYTVYILETLLSIRLNEATNNVSTGEKDGAPVDYETIYVDKTSTQNLFAEDRMAVVTLNESATAYIGNYYLIFSKPKTSGEGLDYFASYPIYFSVSDAGKTLTIDMGYSFAGCDFVGAYLTSIIDKENSGVEINGKNVTFNSTTTLNNFTNRKNALFENGRLEKANRVQLVYAGIDVKYSNYSSSFTDYSIPSNVGIDTITHTHTITSFDLGNGSGTSKSFNLKYYFKPTIDIDVQNKASASKNYIELVVNREDLSIAEMFGIIHPTNGKLIEKSDFNSESTTISIENVSTSTSTTAWNSYGYNDAYGRSISTGKEYLLYTALLTNGQRIYDYNLLPLGAKNTGDYQELKITYTASGFTKTFNVVVKIMPDYIVNFGGSTENYQLEQNGSIIANQNINIISEIVEGGGSYKSFTLAGGDNGYLSIKHQYGNNTQAELSTSSFEITMTKDQVIEATTYNDSTNVSSKFTGITFDSNGKATLSSALASAPLTFTGVKEVVFANQYYFIDGVDSYDYKFRLYFMLQSKNSTPSAVEETVQIKENGYFDIGATYEYLTMTAGESSGDKTPLYISSIEKHPENTDTNITLIEIQGIKAWLFDNVEYDGKESPGNGYDATNVGYIKQWKDTEKNIEQGYQIGDDFKFVNETDGDYLPLANMVLNYVTIEGISFYDRNNNEIQGNKITIDTDDDNKKLATADAITGYFNGFETRAINKVVLDDENKIDEEATTALRMPRIVDTNVFGDGNVANITMVLRLKYEKGDDTEYYDCPVKLSVEREVTIEEGDIDVAVDGDKINLSKIFKIKSKNKELTGVTFTNDTLEVLVSASSTARIEMKLSRGGSEIPSTSVSLSNTGTGYKRTQYISLSRYFGISVKEGDIVTITRMENCELYYVTNSDSNIQNNVIKSTTVNKIFTISNITNDVIYVDNADMLANNRYYITQKYYVVNCPVDGEIYSYRASKTYYVTGKYYAMHSADNSEVSRVLDTETAFGVWSGAIKFQKMTDGGNHSASDLESGEKAYLDLRIDPTSSGSGNATLGSDGTITLLEAWSDDQYLTIVVKMKVSGNDRNIGADDNAGTVTLGSIRLMKNSNN